MVAGNVQIRYICLSLAEVKFGCHHVLSQRRIAELHDDGVGTDRSAWLDVNFLDAAFGGGRKPRDFFGNEGAETMHLAEHRAALYSVRPHGTSFDRR